MTAIDRTIHHRIKRSYTTKELIEAYTPTDEERRFVSMITRTAQNQLNLMLWIKLFPCLGYFPMRRIISEHEITFVNRRHITLDKLEAAKADLINRYFQYDLPKGWGDENVAAADGTQVDLYENNLVSSYHIRYGLYGNITYHIVYSPYSALYSRFLNCGI